MKKSTMRVLAVLTCALATPLMAAESFDATLHRHLASIARHDLDGILATVADGDELRLILPDGTLMQGKKAFADLHRAWFAETDWKMTTRELQRRVGTDLASVLLEATMVDVTPQGDANARSNYLLLQFRKIDGDWRLVHDQNTRKKVPTP